MLLRRKGIIRAGLRDAAIAPFDEAVPGAVPGPDARQQVLVLMGLRNGAAHLQAQLDSLAAQDHADWTLIASDDGSTDGTGAILQAFARGAGAGRVTVLAGPCRGVAANYLSLLRSLPSGPCWVAFADQDDVWMPDRLSRGLAALAGQAGPALYCSRTWIDRAGAGLRLSPARPRPPSFANALVQNVAAGNTILLNPAAGALLAAAAREVETILLHDWWAYQMVTGAGGVVLHDDRPTILYRQHAGNLIGANDGWRARLARLRAMLGGVLRDWNGTNLAALQAVTHRLDPRARRQLQAFAQARSLPGALARIRALRGLGLYRQTRASTAALWLAAALGRI